MQMQQFKKASALETTCTRTSWMARHWQSTFRSNAASMVEHDGSLAGQTCNLFVLCRYVIPPQENSTKFTLD
eukprot:6301323-Amphidinium_carterae.1